jgi:hypothetical protein
MEHRTVPDPPTRASERGLAVKATQVCNVDNCDRKHYARGWCQTHYQRWWASGDVDENVAVGARRARHCQIPACDRKHEARGWCVMHWNRWKRHGDPQPERLPVIGSERRATVGYTGAHMRVRDERGSASDHFCVCGSKAAHWAYDHADPNELRDERGCPYSTEPVHYKPLCVSCHKLFDLAALGRS